jgi:hypothetical protein
MSALGWLPALVLFADHGGNWQQYEEVLYAHFRRDFVDSRPNYRGHRLGLKRYPLEKGKEATFWHFVSEGKAEADRVPNMRRCERICWPRPMIDGVPVHPVRVWTQQRGGERRIAIAVDDFSYIAVLAERRGKRGIYYLPWTAFHVEKEHMRRKFEKEWNENQI